MKCGAAGSAPAYINRSASQRGTKRREYNANHASARKTGLCDFPLFGVLPGGAETAGRSWVTCDEKTVSSPFFLGAKKSFFGRKTANYKLENLACATFQYQAAFLKIDYPFRLAEKGGACASLP